MQQQPCVQVASSVGKLGMQPQPSKAPEGQHRSGGVLLSREWLCPGAALPCWLPVWALLKQNEGEHTVLGLRSQQGPLPALSQHSRQETWSHEARGQVLQECLWGAAAQALLWPSGTRLGARPPVPCGKEPAVRAGTPVLAVLVSCSEAPRFPCCTRLLDSAFVSCRLLVGGSLPFSQDILMEPALGSLPGLNPDPRPPGGSGVMVRCLQLAEGS